MPAPSVRRPFTAAIATLCLTIVLLLWAPTGAPPLDVRGASRGLRRDGACGGGGGVSGAAPTGNSSRRGGALFAPCTPPNPETCDGACAELLAFILKERASSSWNGYYEDVASWVHRHGVGDGGVLVEVGTAYGGLSKYLLTRFPDLNIHAVDPFLGLYDGGDAMSNLFSSLATKYGGSESFPALWARALAYDAGAAAGCRYRLHRERSASAAARYPRRSIDMIFIDGDHTRGGVDADIAAWQGVVKVGRPMLFNDYQPERWPGVVGAVDALAERTGQVVQYLPQRSWGNVAVFNLPELWARPPEE